MSKSEYVFGSTPTGASVIKSYPILCLDESDGNAKTTSCGILIKKEV